MLNLLRNSSARKQLVQGLQDQLVVRARAPVFFTGLGVPDTLDGRFDLVILHAWLVLERLKAVHLDAEAQALMDALFVSFDEALREQGTGDMGMGRKMKAIADAFFGRLKVYAAAGSEDELAAALSRNVWRGAAADPQARLLAAYVTSARTALAVSDVTAGMLDFGPLPDERVVT
jgi:cytochrome b pre-mRNA-processing protein 3